MGNGQSLTPLRSDMDWTPYAIGGATRPDSFTGMQPDMQSRLYAFLQAADAELGPGLQVYSGYRSPELQGELYQNALAKYGSEAAARKWVAPPGKSRHNSGQAADLKFNGVRLDQVSPEVQAWVRENAAKYGLDVPMEWEPWQVELAGARGQGFEGGNALSQASTDQRQMNALAQVMPEYEMPRLNAFRIERV